MNPYPQPSQPAPAPARTGFMTKRPRAWHVAAALTLGLFVLWLVVAMAAATCPPPKPASTVSSGSSSSSSTSAACTSPTPSPAVKALCDLGDTWSQVPTTSPSSAPSKPSALCEANGGIQSMLMLGQVVGIIVTAVLMWKRRKAYTAYRKSVFATEDYERRVPPGSEVYVDLATHQQVAQAAMHASHEMWMNQGYLFAPSGPAVQQRIDSIRETGARAQAAAQQIQMAQYAPADDEPEDLAAPDLGGGDTTSAPPTDDADDWMSGVDNSDNDW